MKRWRHCTKNSEFSPNCVDRFCEKLVKYAPEVSEPLFDGIVKRSELLPDGYLVTAMGDRCLDVVRVVRHPRAVLRVHVHVMLGRRPGWHPQSCAEALCASLQIR